MFSVSKAEDSSSMLHVMEKEEAEEGSQKIIYHLVYSGRGGGGTCMLATLRGKQQLLKLTFCSEWQEISDLVLQLIPRYPLHLLSNPL